MSEIRATGSPDQIYPWWGRYEAPPLEPEQVREAELDEQEHSFWCATEPPAEDLFEIIRRAS